MISFEDSMDMSTLHYYQNIPMMINHSIISHQNPCAPGHQWHHTSSTIGSIKLRGLAPREDYFTQNGIRKQKSACVFPWEANMWLTRKSPGERLLSKKGSLRVRISGVCTSSRDAQHSDWGFTASFIYVPRCIFSSHGCFNGGMWEICKTHPSLLCFHLPLLRHSGDSFYLLPLDLTTRDYFEQTEDCGNATGPSEKHNHSCRECFIVVYITSFFHVLPY